MLGVLAAFILHVKFAKMLTTKHFFVDFIMFERSFAQNLALGGNQAPKTPVKVVWDTPKKSEKSLLLGPFWRHFSIISDVFFVRFFDALQDGPFSDVGAKLNPKPVLLGGVFTPFWDQAEPVKIVLSCWFWLGSEGWRLSQIDVFPELFRVCL